MIGTLTRRLDVVVDDPPELGVPLVDHPRDNGHWHRLHHGHDQRLEQQRKTAVRPTGSPEAVARPRFPQNVACGFPAPTLFGSCFTALRVPAAPGRGGAV